MKVEKRTRTRIFVLPPTVYEVGAAGYWLSRWRKRTDDPALEDVLQTIRSNVAEITRVTEELTTDTA